MCFIYVTPSELNWLLECDVGKGGGYYTLHKFLSGYCKSKCRLNTIGNLFFNKLSGLSALCTKTLFSDRNYKDQCIHVVTLIIENLYQFFYSFIQIVFSIYTLSGTLQSVRYLISIKYILDPL